ncbi:hypothetical protein EI94DRAFT_1707328 [Lactarius quietus]|nr:hypothetical protein EI94DRAFT_1707328 [Lactarius quietus]
MRRGMMVQEGWAVTMACNVWRKFGVNIITTVSTGCDLVLVRGKLNVRYRTNASSQVSHAARDFFSWLSYAPLFTLILPEMSADSLASTLTRLLRPNLHVQVPTSTILDSPPVLPYTNIICCVRECARPVAEPPCRYKTDITEKNVREAYLVDAHSKCGQNVVVMMEETRLWDLVEHGYNSLFSGISRGVPWNESPANAHLEPRMKWLEQWGTFKGMQLSPCFTSGKPSRFWKVRFLNPVISVLHSTVVSLRFVNRTLDYKTLYELRFHLTSEATATSRRTLTGILIMQGNAVLLNMA